MTPPRRLQVLAERAERLGLDEAALDRLVRHFYEAARADPLLGPIFAAGVTDWEGHFARMVAFWSSILLFSGRYHGQPLPLHLELPIDARHFDRWLALFEASARTVVPAAADQVVARARRIAESFELGLAGRRGVMLGPGERLLPDADEAAPASFASPPCFLHELDPAFLVAPDSAAAPMAAPRHGRGRSPGADAGPTGPGRK